jgi:hypothetical protein
VKVRGIAKGVQRCFYLDIQRSKGHSIRLGSTPNWIGYNLPLAHHAKHILNPNYATLVK